MGFIIILVEKRKKLYEGKAKVVYETEDPNKVILLFKDSASAFDGVKRADVEGKGVINNTISSILFEILEREGVKTHYIEKISDREMLVWKAERFPVEVVVRNVATGSIVRRLGVREGTEFSPPLVEFFMKSDELHDPPVCEAHIVLLKLAPPEAVSLMKETAVKVNGILSGIFAKAGIKLVDFKLEFGKLPDGSVAVVDEITPDSMRLWDMKTGERLDKDRFRFDLGELMEGYKEVLKRLSGS
ncbi:MAG: phosphoribosylaminoimidazolesuccinocarboxamide synthase [Aquificota bacterium]|nr:phosphoribosylaminoimidazolesuccinocarboxamide synthase [Aquificota bacterium]